MEQNQSSSPSVNNNTSTSLKEPSSSFQTPPSPVQSTVPQQPVEPPAPFIPETGSNLPPQPPPPQEDQTSNSIQPKEHNGPKVIFYLLLILVLLITAVSLAIIILNSAGLKNKQEETNSGRTEEAKIVEPTSAETKQTEETDKETTLLETQGTSDEIREIEKDLKNTNFTTLDKELSSISSEINQ